MRSLGRHGNHSGNGGWSGLGFDLAATLAGLAGPSVPIGAASLAGGTHLLH